MPRRPAGTQWNDGMAQDAQTNAAMMPPQQMMQQEHVSRALRRRGCQLQVRSVQRRKMT